MFLSAHIGVMTDSIDVNLNYVQESEMREFTDLVDKHTYLCMEIEPLGRLHLMMDSEK